MRGYIPPQNDDERALQNKIAGLVSLVQKTGTSRTTAFLNDREQELAAAAANKQGCEGFAFYGGYDAAERKEMCIFEQGEEPCYDCEQIIVTVSGNTDKLTHRDYLGALMALGIKRECIGDILPSDTGAVMFCVSRMAQFICDNLFEIGRFKASAEISADDTITKSNTSFEERTINVPSLRLDAVLAAMLKTSRTNAAKLISSHCVMINHIEINSVHEPVYKDDIFTIKGKGKYKIIETEGRSKKGRIFVSYRQF